MAVTLGLAGAFGLVAPVSAEERTHTVGEHETLSHVAVRTGTTVAALVEANGLSNPNHVFAGQVLVVPDVVATSAGPMVPYTVQPGDTLSQIAARAGIRTSTLVEVNGLADRHAIRAGSELLVPAGAHLGTATSASMYPHLPERILSRPERLALLPVFEHWAGANGIPVDLLMAISWQESGWNNAAVSSKGAIGIGQIMPDTGTWVARYLIGHPELDPSDPEDNIRISARFLDWLLTNADDEEQAIAAYYQGLASVRRDAPYASTEQYVAAVQAQRRFFVTD